MKSSWGRICAKYLVYHQVVLEHLKIDSCGGPTKVKVFEKHEGFFYESLVMCGDIARKTVAKQIYQIVFENDFRVN